LHVVVMGLFQKLPTASFSRELTRNWEYSPTALEGTFAVLSEYQRARAMPPKFFKKGVLAK
jgi:hypothetical protein